MMFFVWAAVILLVLGMWGALAFLPWYDKIIRRTSKYYPVGHVMKHDGVWHRVVLVKDREGPFDAMFGEKYSDVFLRRLSEAEAAVYEVMKS